MSVKAIVTGARGTVGTALCAAINAVGGEARGWDRDACPPGDERAARALIASVAPDVIFHLALPSRPTGVDNEGWLVNEKWTADMARAAAERGARFVYVSTVMVFTDRVAGPLTPDKRPDADEGYGQFKRQGEAAARAANTDTTVARIGWQIGEARGSNNMIDFLENQHDERGAIEASSRWMPATSFLPDTAVALLDVAAREPGIYHIGGNDRWSFYDIVRALNRRHGDRWTVRPVDDPNRDERLLDDRLAVGRLESRMPWLGE